MEGGVGFSHSIYEHLTGVAGKTYARVKHCDCNEPMGCHRV
ncbi:MAG: DUF1998 domain-containing protein [Halobacteriales archaeon]|nr:DUF1998 domain-containing protein [Halobacteriales archaeon]